LRSGLQRRHARRQPAASGRNHHAQRGGAGRPGATIRRHPRRAGADAAAAPGRRAAAAGQPPADVPGAARRGAWAAGTAARRRAADDAAGRRCRHARAAGAVPWRHDLAAAGGPQARRRAWPDGAAGREDAGVSTGLVRRLDWSALDADARAQALQRPAQQVAAQTRAAVEALVEDGRVRGDAALREITLRFDGVAPESFEVSVEEFAAAEATVPAELKGAMQEAAERIERFHRAGMVEGYAVET